jgi:cytochrome c6
MRTFVLLTVVVGALRCLAAPSSMQAQSAADKIYKANCVLCHSADGSGSSSTGKAMHAKDLRSDEIQKQSDAALAEVITKGRGKMPAFGTKIKPEDVTKLVAYIRALPGKK